VDENDLSLSLFLSLSECVFLRACLLLLFLSDVLFVRRGFVPVANSCSFPRFHTVNLRVNRKIVLCPVFGYFFRNSFSHQFFYKTHTHTDSTEKNRHKRQRVKYIACEIYRIGPPLSVSRHTHFQNKPFFSAFFKTSDENTHVQTHSLQRFAIVCTPSARAREQERKCGGLKRRRRRRRIILVA
jgi:hypothetical protein